MAGETDDEIPESGAVFTFGKSKFADNAPSKFWLKNDVPLRISCGDEHTALVTENGKLFMFGSNNWGQLGLGTKTTVNKPTCVKALKSERVKLAACGRTHTLVYTSRGNLYASGGNNEGQLGLGDCDDRTSFHLVDFFSKHEPVKMLAAGSNTSAALTQDGRLYMWGDNSEGQIGLGKESNALNPREVSVGKRVSWVSCGYYHSAFVTVDGALYTFGEKDSGKLGLSTEKLASHKVPQQVTGISDKVVQVSCGGGHTVAFTEHEVYSFGLGQFGQLGHGTFIFESRLPRVVEHFRRGRVKHVECGENHTPQNSYFDFMASANSVCVFQVTCGGCHMLVLAKPRPEGSEDLILEEDDVTEDYFEKSYTELLGDTHSQTTLNSSLSARVRRRERERSPDQFGQMFRTLPALGGNQLSASLSVPSQIHHSHRKQPGKIPHNSLKIPGRREKSLDDRSSVKDSESLKDLGETTDLLNLTHIMKMDPSDKTLTLSPMEKKKVKVVKEHGKEKGKPRDDPALYRKRAELLARKALPTELLRSSSGSLVVGDSLGSGTPHKSPKRHGQDKENVLIALEDRRPAHHQAARSNIRMGTDISRAGSKSFQPKHKQLIKSRDRVTGKDAGNKVQMLEKEHSKVEAESKKVAHKSKGSTKSKPNQEGKTKPKDSPLEVSSQSQKVVGKEKEVKMKPIIVVEQYLEQTMHKDQEPTGKRISKEILPKAQRLKAEMNAAKTEKKSFVPQSKRSDSKKDSKSKKTTQEVSTTSLSSCQEDISTKKTKKSKAEQSQLLVEDTKKGPTIVSEAAFKSESVSESEQMKENPLTKVTSFLQDVGMESPARLLGETAVSQFLSQSTLQKMPKPPSKQITLSDVSSLSESFEVSGQEKTREAKRTAVTINVKAEPETSDGNLERTSSESKTDVHSVVGTYRRSEEEGEEESDEEEEGESEGLVNRRDESEEVDDQEEESESKSLANDYEVDDDTTIKASSEDEESEEEEEKSKSEATEDVASEAEEAESHGIEDEEEETSEISRKSEEESGENEDESKTSEEEESGEDEDESKTSEEEESGEESEGKIESRSDRSEEESDEEEEDEESEEEESEVEGDTEAEEDEDGEKTSKEEEEDSEKQESETEDDEDEEESESEAEEEESEEDKEENEESEEDKEENEESEEDKEENEESEEDKEENEESEEDKEESEGDKEDEEEGESGEDEAMSENDEEEEENENEQDSKDKEEEDEEEEESEEREETEEAEDEEGEEEDNQEEGEEGKEEEEEQEEEEKKAKRKLEKASESIKPKSSVKTSKQPSKAKRARAQDDQSDDESHESKQFWDDVLPQYLNLNLSALP
ncbi:X-linked retinitis pigmentosa GTPase regulator-like [Sinocyclocheilus rhinocerous]|uniref:X-linked retinitis pigmentosa GTPase regulator n=1 Tax=Sinocyclocheilus rhinocerous TaxID=307959 RepID=A0A673LFS1_9TELE|nr:PREDICTED: X-linked retinitis pigmentosa GTPase regulator-like [Sinocyclocheilus rhinocerous]